MMFLWPPFNCCEIQHNTVTCYRNRGERLLLSTALEMRYAWRRQVVRRRKVTFLLPVIWDPQSAGIAILMYAIQTSLGATDPANVWVYRITAFLGIGQFSLSLHKCMDGSTFGWFITPTVLCSFCVFYYDGASNRPRILKPAWSPKM